MNDDLKLGREDFLLADPVFRKVFEEFTATGPWLVEMQSFVDKDAEPAVRVLAVIKDDKGRKLQASRTEVLMMIALQLATLGSVISAESAELLDDQERWRITQLRLATNKLATVIASLYEIEEYA